MAFSFANATSGGGGFVGPPTTGGPTVRDGQELGEITTDKLGFSAINGSAQLRILPNPWTSDSLPPPSASLLAVASRKGLVAAAGPDAVCLASTAAIRAAIRENPESDADVVRPFNPQMTISYSNAGHVVFSSDESILVVSGQQDGGLDAYALSRLGDGQNDPAMKIATNGQSLRALIPNPAVDSPHLFAAVTNNGELLMADLKSGGLANGNNGPVLKSGVTCCSWSNRGKQLIVGGADGTFTQMKPDGTVVAAIPKSTSIPDGCHVSGLSWLENDSFFVIYTPSSSDTGPTQSSEYYIVTREPKTSNFTFQKLPEVVPPFGADRVPPFHFITRLRNFPPHIQDMLVLTACCSTDIGIITKADQSLANDGSGSGEFTMTSIGTDSRRATLPMASDGVSDTTPIGMALDLSSDEKVPNPIPSYVEILETPGPVPGIMILTNEGHLLLWWVIYNDSIQQSTTFAGIQEIQSGSPQAEAPPTSTTNGPESIKSLTPASTFGQNSFSSAFSKPTLSTFGSGNTQSTFGGSSSDSAFGQPSTIGGSKASWTSTGFGGGTPSQAGSSGFGQSGFGQPGFGSVNALGGRGAPAFGSAGSLGGQTSSLGQSSTEQNTPFGKPPTFGSNSTFSNPSASSPFASAKPDAPSGFASFSQGTGFGTAKKDSNAASPFGQAAQANVFGKPQESPFGSKPGGFGFGSVDAGSSKTPFGAGAFKLDSSFKSDGFAKDDLPKPTALSGFGLSSLGDTLGDQPAVTSPTHDKEEEMEDEHQEASSNEEKPDTHHFPSFSHQSQMPPPQNLVTPPATIGQPKATPAPHVSNLFGALQDTSTTPAPSGFALGQIPSTTPKDPPTQIPSTTPKETPAPSQKNVFDSSPTTNKPATTQKDAKSSSIFSFKPESTPKISELPPNDDESPGQTKIPEAPLPPDPVSKPGYITGDTSVSSLNSKATESPPDDAPLPPDFVPANKSAADSAGEDTLPLEDDDQDEGSDERERGPGEDEASSDFSGSGEDVEEDVSPIEEPTEERTEERFDQVLTSPESSSKSGGKSPEVSPTGDLFTKVTSTTSQKPSRPLFGEVGSIGPILPPPKPQESPRSPSPVRNLLPPSLRSDSSRSVSAPARPRSVIDKRKEEHAQSQMAIQAARAKEEEMMRQKALKAEENRVREQAEAEQLQHLEDHEDDRLRDELHAPVEPRAELDEFVTYQPQSIKEGSKSGVPAQIERLYQDINSMVYTLGINARSLSGFMKYQQEQDPSQAWPSVLQSETPLDALNDEQVLEDIYRLHEGHNVLESVLNDSQINDVTGKLQECHRLLSQDLLDLRSKLAAIRKSISMKSASDDNISAPLSADQASIQQDLRKASALAQNKLVQIEDALLVIRAKLTDLSPPETSRRPSMLGNEARKKPTVEAVANTIAKMTAMAEKKSADIDVLESQLRKLEVAGTPVKRMPSSRGSAAENARTPGSAKSTAASVYHTPNSNFGGSVRGTPSSTSARNAGAVVLSKEDSEAWVRKARRKKDVGDLLVGILADRRKAGATANASATKPRIGSGIGGARTA